MVQNRYCSASPTNIQSEYKFVRQRVRHTKPECYMKIKEDFIKQLEAAFLAVISYPEWLANIVLVPKKGGKVRMCVDYRDSLNKASLQMTVGPHRRLCG